MFLPSLNKVTCLDFTKSHVISYSKEGQFKVQFTNYQYELTKRVNEKAIVRFTTQSRSSSKNL